MSLRLIRPDDAADLAVIHAESFTRPWSAADFATMAADRGAVAIVSLEDEAPIGFILCRRIVDEAEVLTVAVARRCRARGVGRALLDAAAGLCAEAGAAALWLEVAEDNAPALALYRTAGFIESGRRRGYYGRPAQPAVDALVLQRRLTAGAQPFILR